MSISAKAGIGALTDREKQTLRLIVRGHDAKSVAVTLGLSVHTINERLREARRKLAVSSSREAARMLLAAEADATDPDCHGDRRSGEDAAAVVSDRGVAPNGGAERTVRRPFIPIGVILMTLALGLLALTLLPSLSQTPAPPPSAQPATPAPDVARQFLSLVDQGRWDDSYRSFGTAFRKLNTAQTWATVSQRVRTPLGAVLSRRFVGQENLPAPPYGYEVVKFRTRFADKLDRIETVTLEQEGPDWRVVGVTIG